MKVGLRADDPGIALSGSKFSEDALRAALYAKEIGAVILGRCGCGGRELNPVAQHHVWDSVSDLQLRKTVHGIFAHIAKRKLFGYMP